MGKSGKSTKSRQPKAAVSAGTGVHLVQVIAVAAAIAALRVFLARDIQWTRIADEAWYASSAQSFFESLRFWAGGAFNGHSMPLYSLFLSPAYAFRSMDATYGAIKIFNSLAMASTAVPVYLLAREFMPSREARLPALLSVLVGALFYTFMIMAENLHYPLSAWCFLLMYRTLVEDGSRRAQVALGCLFALALLNKMSALVMPLAYAVAILLCFRQLTPEGAFGRFPAARRIVSAFLRRRHVALAFAVALAPYLVYRALERGGNGHVQSIPYGMAMLRYYQRLLHLDWLRLLDWIGSYFGLLVLSTGLCVWAPAVAGMLWWSREGQRQKRILGVLGLVLMLGTVTLAAWQSGYPMERLSSRHFFVLSPLLFIFFMVVLRQKDPPLWMILGAAAAGLALSAHALDARSWSDMADSAWIYSFNNPPAGLQTLGGSSLRNMVLLLEALLLIGVCLRKWNAVRRLVLGGVMVCLAATMYGPYTAGETLLASQRNARLPLIRRMGQELTLPANLVFMTVPRYIAMGHMIWNRDWKSRIFWQGRENLADISPFDYQRVCALPRLLSPAMPTYVISSSIVPEGGRLLDRLAGVRLYEMGSGEPFAVQETFVDVGAPFSREMLGEGWSGDEVASPPGQKPFSFVWAVGGTSSLRFFADRQVPVRLEFRATTLFRDQRATVMVNGAEAGVVEMPGGQWREFAIAVPSPFLQVGENDLSFVFEKAAPPGGPGGRDPRKLTAAFDWVRVHDGRFVEIDFGSADARQWLRQGWDKDEGPYPEMGFPSFVWAAGEQATLAVRFPDARARTLRFRAMTFIPEQTLALTVNGRPAGTVPLDRGWHEYAVPLPAALLVEGENEFSFGFRYTTAALGIHTNDPRALAAAFDWLVAEPSVRSAATPQ